MNSGETSLVRRDLCAPLDVEEKDKMASVDDADLDQKLLSAIRVVLKENAVSLSFYPQQNVVGNIVGEADRPFERFSRSIESQAIAETETDKEVDAFPEQSMETEPFPTTSDEEDSSSSQAGVWIPDAPYGSRGKLLQAVNALKPGQDFAHDYTIDLRNFAGTPHLFLAKHRFGKEELMVLKFYWDEAQLENTIEMHSKFTRSEYVCRIQQTLRTSKTGHPPCIAFEKGNQTLRDWLRGNRQMFELRWCLQQILMGLKDLHAEGIVHGDVKPSNVVFFPESVTWKLIDLDGAQKAGERRAVCFTAHYAAPEVLRRWQDEGELPVAQLSSDIWSYGIVAYEALTGNRMFEDGFTGDEILEFVLEGGIEEKLNSIDDTSHREAISSFLRLDSTERWPVAEALQHEVFQTDPQTTLTSV